MIKNKLPDTSLSLSDFHYDLPEEYIAQTPIYPRDSSRLMVINREKDETEHKIFKDIIDYINPEDVLVINETRVIPARIIGRRALRYDKDTDSLQPVKSEFSSPVELLLLKQLQNDTWEALAGPGKRAKPGDVLEFGADGLRAAVTGITDGGCRTVKFTPGKGYSSVYEALHDLGSTPLPPYIKEKLDNPERYQTVYAKCEGSSAAPTAGLHFTDELLENIQKKGCAVARVLLHVGLGTFRPVKEEKIADHVMHAEYIQVTKEAADLINERKKKGGRVISVGTTSCRVLESASDENGVLHPVSSDTGIFIYPGYQFKITDALITNFHLPESTLLMLVSAFAGREKILSAYNEAVEKKYRFFSFGDAMFIE